MKTYYANAIVQWQRIGSGGRPYTDKPVRWASDGEVSPDKAVRNIALFFENENVEPLIAWIEEFEGSEKIRTIWIKCYIDALGYQEKWMASIVEDLAKLEKELSQWGGGSDGSS